MMTSGRDSDTPHLPLSFFFFFGNLGLKTTFFKTNNAADAKPSTQNSFYQQRFEQSTQSLLQQPQSACVQHTHTHTQINDISNDFHDMKTPYFMYERVLILLFTHVDKYFMPAVLL